MSRGDTWGQLLTIALIVMFLVELCMLANYVFGVISP